MGEGKYSCQCKIEWKGERCEGIRAICSILVNFTYLREETTIPTPPPLPSRLITIVRVVGCEKIKKKKFGTVVI